MVDVGFQHTVPIMKFRRQLTALLVVGALTVAAGAFMLVRGSESQLLDADEITEILSGYRQPHVSSLRSVLTTAATGGYADALLQGPTRPMTNCSVQRQRRVTLHSCTAS
jgi:hypothetical protein